jgi:hypothetical protein
MPLNEANNLFNNIYFFNCLIFILTHYGDFHDRSISQINTMKEEGGNHLPAPPAGCPCHDDGPIPSTPPKTSMATNQYICILKPHSSLYLFQESICSHSSVPHFTPPYNEIVTNI